MTEQSPPEERDPPETLGAHGRSCARHGYHNAPDGRRDVWPGLVSALNQGAADGNANRNERRADNTALSDQKRADETQNLIAGETLQAAVTREITAGENTAAVYLARAEIERTDSPQ